MSLRLDLHLLLRRSLPFLVIALVIIAPALSSVQASSSRQNSATGLQGETKELKGIVDRRPVGTLFGDWAIAGQNFSATETNPITSTFLGFGNTEPQVGTCVDVHYYEASSTTRIIISIAPDNDCAAVGEPTRLEYKGKIISRPELGANGTWTIGDKKFEISAATFFEGYGSTRPISNACVEVSYAIEKGLNVALRIRADDACEGPSSDHLFRGPVDSRPVDKVGDWVIGGRAFTVIVASAFATSFGAGQPAVGDCVGLTYNENPTTSVRTVARIFPDSCIGNHETEGNEAHGTVSAWPGSATIGTWTINGVDYIAHDVIAGTTPIPATVFKQEYGNLGVDVCVQVHYRLEGTTRQAISIETEPSFRCTSSAEDHELYGQIKQLPGTAGQLGPWTIGDLVVVVTPETTLEGGPFALDQLVGVKFERAGDGTLIALVIKVKRSPESEREHRGLGKAYGIISTIPASAPVGEWIIGSKSYTGTLDTLVEGYTSPAVPAIDDCVEIYFKTDAAGARTALKISKESTSECQDANNGNSELSRVYSSVTAMPEVGYVGTWTVAGVDYTANGDTVFKEEHGPLVVGAFVEVAYVKQLDGSLLAKRIRTIVPPGAGDNNHTGKLELPSGPASLASATLAASLSSIKVGGITYTVDAGTLLNGTLTSGMTVLVNSYTNTTGGFVATQVTAANSTYLPLVER